MNDKDCEELFDNLWHQMKSITKNSFRVLSTDMREKSYLREGVGEVVVKLSEQSLLFEEEGVWDDQIKYRNVWRWRFIQERKTLALDHLRYGESKPVFLFELVPDEENKFVSITPHLCGNDRYSGTLEYDESSIHMCIRVCGPEKNEKLFYTYS